MKHGIEVAKQDWHDLADSEMIYWCDKLNAILGMETRQSCSGHKKGDIGKAEGIWGYETNANLWFVCDWITDDIALRFAKVPTMERVYKMYRPDGEMIWDLHFAGNNKGKLDESMRAILETLRKG